MAPLLGAVVPDALHHGSCRNDSALLIVEQREDGSAAKHIEQLLVNVM